MIQVFASRLTLTKTLKICSSCSHYTQVLHRIYGVLGILKTAYMNKKSTVNNNQRLGQVKHYQWRIA